METKICRKCKENKPVDMYSKNKSSVDGLQRNCKPCAREAGIKSYGKNKKKYLSRSNRYNKSVLDNVNQYKANQTCQKCGNDKYYLLDFHHIDPSIKDDNVNTIARTRGKQALSDEIAKCIILCKNCHADFHHLERTSSITIFDYLPNLPRTV
jgi:hypothetical protein